MLTGLVSDHAHALNRTLDIQSVVVLLIRRTDGKRGTPLTHFGRRAVGGVACGLIWRAERVQGRRLEGRLWGRAGGGGSGGGGTFLPDRQLSQQHRHCVEVRLSDEIVAAPPRLLPYLKLQIGGRIERCASG